MRLSVPTAFPGQNIRARVLNGGAISFLAKPVDGPLLIKHISAAAAFRRLIADTLLLPPHTALSRHIAIRTDKIAGPRNRPIRPKVSSPPNMPSKIHRKGKRIELPIRIGRTK
jgi:hypothetical protein